MLKHFAFYYNNRCPIHEKAKYSTSYWPQKPKLKQFKDTEETNKL